MENMPPSISLIPLLGLLGLDGYFVLRTHYEEPSRDKGKEMAGCAGAWRIGVTRTDTGQQGSLPISSVPNERPTRIVHYLGSSPGTILTDDPPPHQWDGHP
jgi:hypothetical protein